MRTVDAGSYSIEIFIAGDSREAIRICRRFCLDVGLCVTVEPLDFVYTGGAEAGVRVGLTNYPRFPSTPEALWTTGAALASALLDGLCQRSYLLRDSSKTRWFTTRADSQ